MNDLELADVVAGILGSNGNDMTFPALKEAVDPEYRSRLPNAIRVLQAQSRCTQWVGRSPETGLMTHRILGAGD